MHFYWLTLTQIRLYWGLTQVPSSLQCESLEPPVFCVHFPPPPPRPAPLYFTWLFLGLFSPSSPPPPSPAPCLAPLPPSSASALVDEFCHRAGLRQAEAGGVALKLTYLFEDCCKEIMVKSPAKVVLGSTPIDPLNAPCFGYSIWGVRTRSAFSISSVSGAGQQSFMSKPRYSIIRVGGLRV